ncbi:MAG: Crp/Fnr family transcriptional regulator [Bdellovibrionales bacterium]|nr:Crp/Fnr family transcriptional regulator [Bdellovibrionales bacterium]
MSFGRQLLSQLKKIGTGIEFKTGKIFFEEGDLCQSFLLLETGLIKVYKISEKGQELTLYRVDADNLCTLTTSSILSNSYYPANGIAETDGKGIVLSRQDFNQLISDNQEFKELVFSSLTTRFNQFVEKIDEIAFHSLKERLWSFLNKNCNQERKILLTHQELAKELGVERESISRALKVFEKARKIQSQRGIIKIV